MFISNLILKAIDSTQKSKRFLFGPAYKYLKIYLHTQGTKIDTPVKKISNMLAAFFQNKAV